jgi:hypothetical protein
LRVSGGTEPRMNERTSNSSIPILFIVLVI